jgi:hypothetical protein
VIALDPFNRQMKISFNIKGEGSFFSARKSPDSLTKPVTVEFDTNTVDFLQFERHKIQHLIANMDSGDPNEYPYDVYSFQNYLLRAHTNGSHVALAMKQSGTLQGWKLSYRITELGSADPDNNDNYLKLSITASRSTTTLAFSMLLFLVMWLLSFGAFMLTVCYITFGFLEPPLIAILGTMLFALPAVRNTQPGVPPIGCILDVAGLFWNMVLLN